MPERPLIAVAIGAFWPGNEASGPNQSFRALCAALGDEFRFRLLARDRPFGATAPVRGERVADALYLPPGRTGVRGLVGAMREMRPDLIWLNGFWDRDFTWPTLLARRTGLLAQTPVLVSPRGEFHPGALGVRPRRKHLARHALRWSGLLGNATLHAADAGEGRNIAQALPFHRRVAIAATPAALPPPFTCASRSPGPLRLVFLGRIAPNKNLRFALETLAKLRAPASLAVLGPVEDSAYGEECRRLAALLPPHVSVEWRGGIPRAEALAALRDADLLFLPSAGESFGHAIFEALAAGTPVLVSDRTPWRGLAPIEAGWDLPLGDPQAFADAIDVFAALAPRAREAWRHGARRLAEAHAARSGAADETRAMLHALLRERNP